MSGPKIPTPALIGPASVYVALDGAGEVSKLETFPRFDTGWRGERAIVTMSADRYQIKGWDGEADHLTEWRTYATEARSWDGTDQYRAGTDVTDTARHRLSDACKPAVTAWLESPEYVEAERVGLVAAIGREVADRYRYWPDACRRTIARHADRIGEAATRALGEACDALDAYAAAMSRAGE